VDYTFFIKLAIGLTLVLISWLMLEFFSKAIRNFTKKAGAKPSTLHSIRDVLRVIWFVLAATGLISYLGLTSEYTTLTVSGIAGIAITLSLQSTLSNVISGILLFYDKTIRVDDEVQFSGITGKVVYIALRNTWIETKEGSIVIVSNSNLANGPLINYSAKERLKKTEI
jgi:small conductance mechanosensitive channel